MNMTGGLQDDYEMSQSQVGEKLFLRQQTIQKIERRAMDSFKQALEDRGINYKDLLGE